MLLVLGGLASGKRSYVRSLGYDDRQMGAGLDAPTPVLLDLDELLRAGPLDEAGLRAVCQKEVVVCCEVGQGVVPIDAGERAWRELVGRTTVLLAAEATTVVRLVCGIPVIIKPEARPGEAVPTI